MRALVTGASGFVGRSLAEHLEASGDEVFRLNRSATSAGSHRADIQDGSELCRTVRGIRPEAVYHLAAISYGPAARDDIATATAVNIGGTLNLLEACRHLAEPPTVLIPSSSEVYAPKLAPLTELDPTGPTGPYGATKLAQEALALAYHHAGTLNVAIARAFNHIGPGQRSEFVVPAFAGQLARIAAGAAPPVMHVGNLDAIRDFTDVRDVVRAYRLILGGNHTGEPLNVASGVGVKISDLLATLVDIAGIDVHVEVDPSRVRTREQSVVVGDASRLREATGWRPTVPLRQTLEDAWGDARARYGSPA